jgi:hypothetical protein
MSRVRKARTSRFLRHRARRSAARPARHAVRPQHHGRRGQRDQQGAGRSASRRASAHELGNYRSRKASAMLNVPVSDMLALRAALAWNRARQLPAQRPGHAASTWAWTATTCRRAPVGQAALGQDATLLLRYERSKVRRHQQRQRRPRRRISTAASAAAIRCGTATAPSAPDQQLRAIQLRRRAGLRTRRPSDACRRRPELEPGPGHPVVAGRPPQLRTRRTCTTSITASRRRWRSACATTSAATTAGLARAARRHRGRRPLSAQGGVYWFRETRARSTASATCS